MRILGWEYDLIKLYLYLPEFKLGIVVLSNWSGMNASSTAFKIANIVLGKQMAQTKNSNTKATSTHDAELPNHSNKGWEKWLGTYAEPDKSSPLVHLFTRNSQPWMNLPDGTGVGLKFIAPSTFVNREKNLKATCTAGVNDWPRYLKIQSPSWNNTVKDIHSLDLNQNELNDYIGVYHSSELLTDYRIEAEGQTLRAIHHRHNPVVLKRFAKDRFTSNIWYWSKVDFDRDMTGNVTGLRVTQGRNHNMVFLKKTLNKITH